MADTKKTVRRDSKESARQWVLSIVQTPCAVGPRSMKVEEPSVPIVRGRNAGMGAIGIGDPAVSAEGARLRLGKDLRYELVDEGVLNAIRVNGERVRGATRLADNDVIRIGDTLIVFERYDPARQQASLAKGGSPLLEGLGMYDSTAASCLFVDTCLFDPELALVAVRVDGFTEARLMAEWLGRAWGRPVVRLDAADPATSDALATADPAAAVIVDRLDALEPAEQGRVVTAIEDLVRAPGRRAVAFTYADAGPRSLIRRLLDELVDVAIEVPGLAQRRADILPALASYLDRFTGGAEVDIPPICAEKMLCYGWPGGIGELKRVARRIAKRLAEAGVVDRLSLPAEIRAVEVDPDTRHQNDLTQESFEEVFVDHGGNLTEIADHYGYARTYLYRILRQKGIDLKALRRKHDI